MNSNGFLVSFQSWVSVNSWPFLIIGFVFMVILLFFDHGEAWEKFITAKGRKRILPGIKLVALWGLLPVTILYSVGAQWGADADEKRITELESKNIPRIITANQKRMIINALTPFAGNPNLTLNASSMDKESADLSNSLLDAIKSAGINPEVNWTGSIFGAGPPPTGIEVSIRNGTNPPPLANACLMALKAVGLDCRGIQYPNWNQDREDKIVINIYKKPDSN
jgi:hypothetical protein